MEVLSEVLGDPDEIGNTKLAIVKYLDQREREIMRLGGHIKSKRVEETLVLAEDQNGTRTATLTRKTKEEALNGEMTSIAGDIEQSLGSLVESQLSTGLPDESDVIDVTPDPMPAPRIADDEDDVNDNDEES